jgi:hypothetical protein
MDSMKKLLAFMQRMHGAVMGETEQVGYEL